ncbi:MAG: hypothetical protein U0I51_10770, partial [Muricomes sp.]|nr:hypothetical protein [Muricomes sp.]
YKRNRYHLAGISVSDAWNCGIHQNGFMVLRFRNSSSESPGILTIGTSARTGWNQPPVWAVPTSGIFKL